MNPSCIAKNIPGLWLKTKKSLKVKCAFAAKIILGGSPIRVATPSRFEQTAVPKIIGTGLILSFFAIEKAIVFGTYENAYGYVSTKFSPLPANIISGAFAGLSASFVVTPYERIKILRQTNTKFNWNQMKPSSLFKGLSVTFTREMPGFAIYFSVYKTIEVIGVVNDIEFDNGGK